MIQQSGKIIIATPSKRYDSSWHHSNTLNDERFGISCFNTAFQSHHLSVSVQQIARHL
jgi:hypothetical protein